MDPTIDWLLLERWLAGECSPGEAAAVQRWVDADAANARLAGVMGAAWKRAGGMRQEPTRDVAAAWRMLAPKLQAPSSRPVLQLVPARRRMGVRAAGIAAAVLLAVGGVVTWQLAERTAASSSTTLQQVNTGPGQRAGVTLSDGTRVLVGVASRLRFAPSFGPTRDVYLEGEGFFQVAHDASRPFIVHTVRGTARALGTSFDVRAYSDDTPIMSVVVTEGSVALKGSASPRDSLILQKADLGQLQANHQLVQISGVDTAAYLAWTRGELVFDRTPVPDVVRQLTRWYGIDVQLGDAMLASHAVTASLGQQPFVEAIQTVSATLGARVERRGTSYVLLARR